MDYSKYIIPLNGGTGFVINNLFITAGHVVDKEQISINILGINYKRVFWEVSNKSDGVDLAIYKCETNNSPLCFEANIPPKDTEFINYSYKHFSIKKECNNKDNFFYKTDNEEIILETTTGKVIEYYDNYIECIMDTPLCEGRSGSPLMNGKNVVGILIGDKDGKKTSNTVLFLSSKAIIHCLNLVNR